MELIFYRPIIYILREGDHGLTISTMRFGRESDTLMAIFLLNRISNMRTLIFISCMFLASFAQASSYQAGDQVTPIQLEDQFENAVEVNANTLVLLFSRDMKGGDIIKEALELQVSGADKIPATQVYIADISGMPSLIAKFVAIPQMKDLPFPMGLDKEGEMTKLLPSKEDMASLILLDNLKVIEVHNFDSSAELIKALR